MDVREVFEIQLTARYIVTRGFARVCLQFPDSLLPHAISVHDALRAECDALIRRQHVAYNGDIGSESLLENPSETIHEGSQEQASLSKRNLHGSGLQGLREGQGEQPSEPAGVVRSEPQKLPQLAVVHAAEHAADGNPPRLELPHFYVLADAATATCSSCCVDEVSPCHVSADCIVHYGHACMSRRPARFPVRYVLPRQPIDVAACAAAMRTYFSSSNKRVPARVVLVLFALEFAHAADDLALALGRGGKAGGGERKRAEGVNGGEQRGEGGSGKVAESEELGAEGLKGGAEGLKGEAEGLKGEAEGGKGEEVRYVVAQVREREVEPEEGGKSAGADTCRAVSGGCCTSGGVAESNASSSCDGSVSIVAAELPPSTAAAAAPPEDNVASSAAAAQCAAAQCAAPGTVFEHGGLRWVLPPGTSMAAEAAKSSTGGTTEKSSNEEKEEEAAAAVGATVVWVGSSDDSPSLITLALEYNQTAILRLDPNEVSSAAAARRGEETSSIAADRSSSATASTATTASSSSSSSNSSSTTATTATTTTTTRNNGSLSPFTSNLALIAPIFHPVDHSRLLRRRYFLVEKAKDASIVGIVLISQAAGAAAAATRATVERLRKAAVTAGKKAYVIAIRRRITPEKLANFPECDMLVMVACAEGVLVDSREFYAPVVTPFEALMAFEEGREWTGEYRMLVDDAVVGEKGGGGGGVVREGEAGSGEGSSERNVGRGGEEGDGEDKAPRFSFVRGSLVSHTPHNPAPSPAAAAAESSSLAIRQDMSLSAVPVSSEAAAMARAASQSGYATSAVVEARSGSEFLALRRDYKGLEVPWFMAPGEGQSGGGAPLLENDLLEMENGVGRGKGDGQGVGAFMPRVAPAIEAVRVVEGREGRAAGYVDEPEQQG
ncbi:hypothetical protein CLOM_g16836 [Closterium sp. NIES-68]|nr:hypothetical protein CLOM_g16836 [Closterium sp. NIES-68]GJP75636.1 hypothetical protein CLOP_g6064 [Closterium sp. NIES-67]